MKSEAGQGIKMAPCNLGSCWLFRKNKENCLRLNPNFKRGCERRGNLRSLDLGVAPYTAGSPE